MAHVDLAQVGDGAGRLRRHALGHPKAEGARPVPVAAVVARDAVELDDDVDRGAGTDRGHLQEIVDRLPLKVVVGVQVNEHRPARRAALGLRRRGGQGGQEQDERSDQSGKGAHVSSTVLRA
jgi:hypothetical protein